ncbi:MAG: hypothetical protein ACREPM_08865 [Gemmatimonadaceae bacterium]
MTGQTTTPPAPPPPPALPQIAAPATDLATMQTQFAELHVQLAGLDAQWRGLKSQLDQMLRNNPARPGVQQQWADVGVQRARVQGDIARLAAEIALKHGPLPGRAFPGQAPPSNDVATVIPVVSVVLLILAFPVALAWSRRIFRGPPRGHASLPADLTMRLDRMEQAVDTIAIEVERVSEGQRFMTKIMVERPAANSANAPPSDLSTPPLALGAGPLEPIVAQERERVRERVVTPH